MKLTWEEHPFGLSWVIGEPLSRTSHALEDDGRVWLVDPVDTVEVRERIEALGTPAGVLQLLDRHSRDCAALARRFGVPHLVNPAEVPGSPFEPIPVLRVPRWRETALWWPARRVLVVAEAVGTHPVWAAGAGPAGIHPLLRLRPPGALRGRAPAHLLVGHGHGIHGAAAAAELERAYARSRRDLPALATKLPSVIRSGR